MDKLEAWREINFDVMFHGDDWKNSKLYDDYQKKFKEVGVEIVFLPHTEGVSSTELTEKIRR